MQCFCGLEITALSHLKNAFGADDEEVDRGRGKMGSGTKTGKSLLLKHLCRRGAGRHGDQDKKRLNKICFAKSFQFLVRIFNPAGKSRESLEERTKTANEAWRKDARICQSKDVPWRMKCKKNGGTSLQRFLLWL